MIYRNILLSVLIIGATGYAAYEMNKHALMTPAMAGADDHGHGAGSHAAHDEPHKEEDHAKGHVHGQGEQHKADDGHDESRHMDGDNHDADEHHAEEIPKGPNGGKLFRQDGFSLELVLYERGVDPEYHAYARLNGLPVQPETVQLEVELGRLGGQVDHIGFKPLGEFLRGQMVVAEPHSFDVSIQARHAGKRYQWAFSSYEGRTRIPAELAADAGIGTQIAGPVTLQQTLELNGRVQANPARMAQVRARFEGVVQRVQANLGQTVKKGEVLASVQSNESLQSYKVRAPIDGVILRRDVQVGSITGEAPLFLIADMSQVWVELDVFPRDLAKVQSGQAVSIRTLEGAQLSGQIGFISPLAMHASQSVQARVVLNNPQGLLRPGQFVSGAVTVAEHELALAVRESGIQRFRDFQVVYARIGDQYEVRMLELGRRNAEWVEVLGGLQPGTEYVSDNSYLIKADIDKSAASHDH